MANNAIHSMALYISNKLNITARKNGLDFIKMVYGMEIFLINVSKLTVVYTFSAILGIADRTFIIHLAYMLIRRYSFGLHALRSFVCTVVSVCFFVGLPFLTIGVGLNNLTVLLAFLFINLSLFLYAPADTKATPIIGEHRRRIMKKKAVCCGIALMVLTLVIPNESTKFLLTAGAAFQCVLIHPVMYKILKRSERNYEKYENAE